MVSITFFQQEQRLVAFDCTGHADYDEEGYDIVCAGISALTQTITASLMQQLSAGENVQYQLQKGFLNTRLPEHLSEEDRKTADILLKALITGLQMIQEQYPETISVVIKTDGR